MLKVHLLSRRECGENIIFLWVSHRRNVEHEARSYAQSPVIMFL